MLSKEEFEKKKERELDRKRLLASLMEDIKLQNKNKNMIELLQKGYITFRKIHKGYEEFLDIKEKIRKGEKPKPKVKIPQFFGKWQYFFIKGDKVISMVQLKSFQPNKKWDWEIFAFYDERLFEDTMAFATKDEAMEKVNQLLGD